LNFVGKQLLSCHVTEKCAVMTMEDLKDVVATTASISTILQFLSGT
jgi:hypothetical protein